MRIYLLFILTLISVHCYGQDKRTNDSLLHVLKASKEDTNKANILIQLCRNNLDIDNKAVAEYNKDLFALSTKLNFGKGLADSYNFLGIIEDDKANYSKALDYYKIAMDISVKHGLEKKKASIENNIGLIYWKIGDQQKALGYYYDALKVFDKLGEKKMQANALSNIGLIHSSLKDQKRALEFQRRALAIRLEMKDDYGLASTYNNMAKSFTQKQEEDSSRYYAQMALAMQLKMEDNYGLGISTGNLALSFSRSKKYDSAIYYLKQSEAYRKVEGDKLGLIFTYQAFAEVYSSMKKLQEALKYGLKAAVLSNEIDSKERKGNSAKILSEIYADLGDYESAYRYLKFNRDYLNDIFDTIKNQQSQELAVKYEVEKKDLLIAKDKAELKGKQAQIENQNLKLSQRNTQLGLLAVLLITTALVSYFIYNRNRLKQAARLQQEIIRQQDMAAKAIIEAEESERKRIAADLHDGVGQLCSAIKMNLSGLNDQVTFKDKEAVLAYEKTMAITDEACKEVRSISHQMMPNILLKSGLAVAVRDFLDKIDARRLQVQLDTFGLNERLDSKIETVLYRVIQETVNNVIKHAKANRLYITLDKDTDGISVTIEDNGTGFDIHDKEKFDGIGIKNITSRVEFLKGKVEFDSAPGRGTVVNVWVPS
jgi:two-component system NarL family sensor kinase